MTDFLRASTGGTFDAIEGAAHVLQLSHAPEVAAVILRRVRSPA